MMCWCSLTFTCSDDVYKSTYLQFTCCNDLYFTCSNDHLTFICCVDVFVCLRVLMTCLYPLTFNVVMPCLYPLTFTFTCSDDVCVCSILNSVIVILFLSGLLAVIIQRSLRKDTYYKLDSSVRFSLIISLFLTICQPQRLTHKILRFLVIADFVLAGNNEEVS